VALSEESSIFGSGFNSTSVCSYPYFTEKVLQDKVLMQIYPSKNFDCNYPKIASDYFCSGVPNGNTSRMRLSRLYPVFMKNHVRFCSKHDEFCGRSRVGNGKSYVRLYK